MSWLSIFADGAVRAIQAHIIGCIVRAKKANGTKAFPRWHDLPRQCRWCPKEYPRGTPGSTPLYCSPECEANAQYAQDNHKAQRELDLAFATGKRSSSIGQRRHRAAPKGASVSKPESVKKWLDALPKRPFTFRQAQAALGIGEKPTIYALKQLEALGKLRKERPKSARHGALPNVWHRVRDQRQEAAKGEK